MVSQEGLTRPYPSNPPKSYLISDGLMEKFMEKWVRNEIKFEKFKFIIVLNQLLTHFYGSIRIKKFTET